MAGPKKTILERHPRHAARGLLECVVACLLVGPPAAAARAAPHVAPALLHEQDFSAAAVEFRRGALNTADRTLAGNWYWAAAYAYFLDGDHTRTQAMLDRAEDYAPEITLAALLLHGENALTARRTDDARFYLEGARRADPDGPAGRYARIRLARAAMQAEPPKVTDALEALPEDLPVLRARLARYPEAPRRNPRLGGWLGIVPGLGYAYAGEYANALRSLILNTVFIWGMLETAERHQWGAFAVISLFEATWFSGSIYGGIDAAHRFNRAILQQHLDAIDAAAGFEPDFEMLPVIAIQFRFP